MFTADLCRTVTAATVTGTHHLMSKNDTAVRALSLVLLGLTGAVTSNTCSDPESRSSEFAPSPAPASPTAIGFDDTVLDPVAQASDRAEGVAMTAVPSSRLSVRVVRAATDEPLADVEISVASDANRVLLRARTSADGSAVVAALAAGVYTVSVTATLDGTTVHDHMEVTIAGDRDRLVDFRLAPAGSIELVASIDGDPAVAELRVVLTSDLGGRLVASTSGLSGARAIERAEDGRYVLRGIHAGRYTLELEAALAGTDDVVRHGRAYAAVRAGRITVVPVTLGA